jgi:hypothetical protein
LNLRLVVGLAITVVWVLGFLMAFFVDRRLEGLAQTATPVMLVFVGFLFARVGFDLGKEKPNE